MKWCFKMISHNPGNDFSQCQGKIESDTEILEAFKPNSVFRFIFMFLSWVDVLCNICMCFME